jgi:hypothetical protein
VLGESVPAVPYDPLGYYHLPEGTLPVYRRCADYQQAIAQFTPEGAEELGTFVQRLLTLYEPLRQIPSLGLRPDLGVVPLLLRSPGALDEVTAPPAIPPAGEWGTCWIRQCRIPGCDGWWIWNAFCCRD